MTGFYMGYDAEKLTGEELLQEAKKVVDTGLQAAGFRTMRLGNVERFGECAPELIAKLRRMGFQSDVLVKATDFADIADATAKLGALNMQAITLDAIPETDKTTALAKAIREANAKLRIVVRVAGQDDIAWATEIADVVELPAVEETKDYFEITRHCFDSCRDGDVDIAKADANLRADMLKGHTRYQVGTLPLWFDDERNLAILSQAAMLGCPLVIEQVGEMTDRLIETLKDPLFAEIASLSVGRVVRYYDPWHVLMGKKLSDSSWYMLILNRCHGDCPTDILPADLGWSERFAVTDLLEGKLLCECVSHFEVHVETSDHPSTPCCAIYQIDRVIE